MINDDLKREYMVWKYGLRGIQELIQRNEIYIRIPVYSPVIKLFKETEENIYPTIDTIVMHQAELKALEKELLDIKAMKLAADMLRENNIRYETP